MYDVVVIGAGLGGLMAAAKLARAGRRVVVLEKKALPGGTSYVFRRGGYAFPMGPLSFGFPARVQSLLAEAGVAEDLVFRRSTFEIRTPALDIIVSRPLVELEADLVRLYPKEKDGLARFFEALRSAMALSKDMDLWHPDFRPPGSRDRNGGPGAIRIEERARAVADLARTPAAGLLDGPIADRPVRNLLGAMGSEPPEMSLLNLAIMWNVMAEAGIWFPEPGVHVLADLLSERLIAAGGELRLATPVRRIAVKDGRAAGAVTASGELLASDWVVSNADYKTTFLELVDGAAIPGLDLEAVRPILYDIGINIAHPVEPESNDIYEVKKKWAGKMALIGNIPTPLLAFGSAAEVDEMVREYCVKVAPGGGYALGSSTSIMDGVRPENFVAMVEAVHKYGRYASLGKAN